MNIFLTTDNEHGTHRSETPCITPSFYVMSSYCPHTC